MRFSILATLASLALSYAADYNGVTDPWSFDMEFVQNPAWMSTVRDDVLLSQLSIPGTHNSMTDRIGKIELQSQKSPLNVQLHSGIRYFDISGRIVNNDLQVYHRDTPTGYNFGDVFSTIFGFLDANPREVVILRIQKEYFYDRTSAFSQVLNKYLTPGTLLGNAAANRVYVPSGDKARIPTLGELRGRLVILQDFKKKDSFRYFGIPWSSSTISSYSFRPSPGNVLKGARWSLTQCSLRKIGWSSAKTLFITHTSVSYGARPVDIAGGGSGTNEFGMNRYLGEFLRSGNTARIGVMVMDFPGAFLINAIIRLNTPYGAPQPIDPGAANPGSYSYPPASGVYPPPAPGVYPPNSAPGVYPHPAAPGIYPPPPVAYREPDTPVEVYPPPSAPHVGIYPPLPNNHDSTY
ncbi:hypothetical protein Cpir12675_005299 [Ceratocystis pirilliformis]|uniref:Phosphatidylinositol-specific phospholipase C X domain-containing protein n=1 Tax=Ceratocystis pirilliformis TaxID=259994 RepID=A0ABR3YRV6_9PEZI